MATKFTITCGLLSCPVKLDAGARPERISLRMMTADGHPVGQRLYDKTTGKEIERTDTRKGFEHGESLIELTKEDLDAIEPQSAKTITLDKFVPDSTIDPLYFDSSQYVSPQDTGVKAYTLIWNALKSAGKIGIGTITEHARTCPVALRASAHGLVLFKLFFENEVRDTRQFRADLFVTTEAERDLTAKFVEAMSAPAFDSSAYRDEYTERLTALIDSKRPEKKDNLTFMPAPQVDIMAALTASLDALRPKEEPKKRAKKGVAA